ncbi:gamma-glutamylcyclotransferase [Tropicibacter sp. R15_0]|uniref:gamma-glutamylcyclotransferase family protein n=1 Tax=Tropicibacter sp. R15_0 TaxID=2821101 RepID=UPI001ADC6F6B|nr:gamma-glutamylcyclotransferase family protein [Tropicibacter sp. R15_0]MBO9463723.1 gamma-glutamylcyclotransferase [Tropicibacter sp. R15_0]
MTHAYFFGYGSLVDERTHDFSPVEPALARGWHRAWVATPDRDLCFLTAIRDESSEILGLVAPVPGQDWQALDHRERAYDRHEAAHEIDHHGTSIAIYSVAPARRASPGNANVILLSYLDVVIQGYVSVFGQAGADHFFATTDGWHAPILNDRANPVYPRAQPLSEETRQIVDDALSGLQATFRTQA